MDSDVQNYNRPKFDFNIKFTLLLTERTKRAE